MFLIVLVLVWIITKVVRVILYHSANNHECVCTVRYHVTDYNSTSYDSVSYHSANNYAVYTSYDSLKISLY